jgi:hypothetical protein
MTRWVDGWMDGYCCTHPSETGVGPATILPCLSHLVAKIGTKRVLVRSTSKNLVEVKSCLEVVALTIDIRLHGGGMRSVLIYGEEIMKYARHLLADMVD